MARKSVEVGDIFEIPLSKGRRAFGRYVYADKRKGPLIEVFNLIVAKDKDVDPWEVVSKPRLFPPVITGLFAAVRTSMWKVVGNVPVEQFEYPRFISTFEDEKTGEARVWFLWDGRKETKIGWSLPEDYKELEFLMVWDPHDVVQRIETGEYPFPYRDLIRNNRFEPRR